MSPWSPAQRRLFGYQYSQGKISRAELDRRMAEGTRTDVDKKGYVEDTVRRKKQRKLRKRG